MKVLIAEDDFTSRTMLAAVLKKGGYEVVAVSYTHLTLPTKRIV